MSICGELDKMNNDECDILLNEIMSLLKCGNRKTFIRKLLFNKQKEIFNHDILNAMCTKSFAINSTISDENNINTNIATSKVAMAVIANEQKSSQTQFHHIPVCILAEMSSFLCNDQVFKFGETNRECYLSTQITLYFKYRSDRYLLINDKSVTCINNGEMNIFNYSHCNEIEIDIKSKLLQSTFKQSVLINNTNNNNNNNNKNNSNEIKPNKGLISALYHAKNLSVNSRNAGIIPINIIFDKNKSQLNNLQFYGRYSFSSDDRTAYSLAGHEPTSPFKQFSKNYDNYFKNVCNSDLKCVRNLNLLTLHHCTSNDNSICDIDLQDNFQRLSLGYTSGDHGNISLTNSNQCQHQEYKKSHFERFIHSNLKEFSLSQFWMKIYYLSSGPGHDPFDNINNINIDSNITNTAGKSLTKLNINLNCTSTWRSWHNFLDKMFTFWEKMNVSQNVEDINISFRNCVKMADDWKIAAGRGVQRERMTINHVIKHLIEKIITNNESTWQQIKTLQVKVYSASKELVDHCFDAIWDKRNSLESNYQCNFKLFIAKGKHQVLHKVSWDKNEEVDEQKWKNKQKHFLKLMKIVPVT